MVVFNNLSLGNLELEVEDIEEFALDLSNVPLSEYSCAYRPIKVFERSIVQILNSLVKSK